jgi:hypothetical protein
MNLPARLRSSSRGILVWMLLAAYVCAPLAAWAQPRSQSITVPFCTAQGPTKSGTGWPRRIVLRFTSHPQVAASIVAFALPSTADYAFGAIEHARFESALHRAPIAAPPIAWRPPPRAPPASPARV